MKNRTFKEFLWEAFSEDGIISFKRCAAGFIIFCLMIILAISFAKDGFTENVHSSWDLAMISACSLAGVSSITGIWKGGSKTQIKQEENENEGDTNLGD